MSEPIKIVLTAETQAAAKALQDFCNQANVGFKTLSSGAHEAKGVLMENRAAIMELEHSARSMADGLIAGINPLRMMAMEGPRLLQAGSVMTDEFKSKLLGFLPILGGVGVAIAAGATAWHFYGDAIVDPTKRVRELADALQAVPDQLKKIQTALRAGVITPEKAEELRDLVSGKTPLYNVSTVPDGFGGHALTTRPEGTAGFLGGTPVPLLTTNATRVVTPAEQTVVSQFGPVPSYGAPHEVVEQLQPANAADRRVYGDYRMRQAGVTDANNVSPAADVSAVRLRQEEMRWMQQSELGPDKQEERIRRQADEAKNTLQEEHGTAQTSKGWTADDEKKYQDQIKSIDADADRAITQLKQRAATEAANQQREAISRATEEEQKIQEQAYRTGAEKVQELEQGITIKAQQQGALRGQFAEEEYRERYDALSDLYEAGELKEEEYTAKLNEAWQKRVEGIKQYEEELRKIASLQQAAARDSVNAQLKGIQDNPALTPGQRDAQSVPLLMQMMAINELAIRQDEAEKATAKDLATQLQIQAKINQAKAQQVELSQQVIKAQMPASPVQAFAAEFQKLRDQAEITWTTIADTFANVFNTAIGTISQNFTKLIEGTESWRKALMNISNTILNEIIGSIVQMGVRWVMTQIMMAIAGRSVMAAAQAATAPMAAAQSAIWATPATLSTIATFGASAMAAPGFIAGAEAMTLGLSAFADGGRPPLGQMSLVGEEGPELFIPDTAGTIIPADQTARMLGANPRPVAGAGSPTGSGAPGAGNSVSVYSFLDPQEMQHHLEQNDDHEKWVVSVMGRNAHKLK